MKKEGVKCATNGCSFREGTLFRCHVIHAHKNFTSGTRYVAYMCNSCNQTDDILDINENATFPLIPNCDCGVDLVVWKKYPGQYVRDEANDWYHFYPQGTEDKKKVGVEALAKLL
jgi:hypothetical protein